MTSTTQFLAYIPSPPRGVWDLGPIPLRAYALFIIVGIVVAIFWGEKRWVARGGEAGTILDIAIWAVPFGLVGGRIYHVLTDWSTYFGADGRPGDAIKIWEGGLGIWGAVFFGAIGAWLGCRQRGVPLAALGDAIAPPILLAQAIGRLGNFYNQELYGRETTLPWGLQIYERVNSDGAVDALNGVSTGVVEKVVHPTFLYELLWNLIVVALLVLIDRRYAIGHGRLFALYVAGYCFGRFWIELMRDDFATHIFGVRINSITSALVFVLAVAYFVLGPKGREAPEELLSNKARDVATPTAESAGTEDAVTEGGEAEAASTDEAVPAEDEPAAEETSTADAKASAEEKPAVAEPTAEAKADAGDKPAAEKKTTVVDEPTTDEKAGTEEPTKAEPSESAAVEKKTAAEPEKGSTDTKPEPAKKALTEAEGAKKGPADAEVETGRQASGDTTTEAEKPDEPAKAADVKSDEPEAGSEEKSAPESDSGDDLEQQPQPAAVPASEQPLAEPKKTGGPVQLVRSLLRRGGRR